MIKNIVMIMVMSMLLISCGSEAQTISQVQSGTTQEPKQILALGDSVTAGYNLDLSEAYPAQLENLLHQNGYNYRVTNAGVSGDTSKNLLDRIELYDAMEVDIYLLTIGGNDGLRRQSVETMKQNIGSIIEHLQTMNPQSQIVISGMQIPINLGWNYSKEFQQSYEDIVEQYELPFYEFFLEDVAKKSDLNLSDGIHPNASGYQIIAQNIYDFLEDEDLIIK